VLRPSLFDRDAFRETRVARHVSKHGHQSDGVVLIRPKAFGFQPGDRPNVREMQPVVPGFSKSKQSFMDKSMDGKPVSEVFMRFEGKTPWKLVGEVVSDQGVYEEAVRAQWPLLIEHSYYLFRKVRFWLPTEFPIQFGYSDANAEIVQVTKGPLPLGTDPLELKAMLHRCGFLGAKKPRFWRHMHSNVKDKYESKKDHHRKNPRMMDRKYNTKLEAHKWFDPRKYKGRYMQVQKGKSKGGIVTGTGASR
ncbi:unnamed protein product, partial [Polarella glacialis]